MAAMSSASRAFDRDGSSPRSRSHLGAAARIVDRALPALQAGRLQLILPNGEVIARHGDDAGPDATISLHHWRALWRVLFDGEHGFADGYLNGDWSTPELGHLLELLLRNEAVLMPQAESGWLGLARNRVSHWWHANSRRGSRRNIAAHYDLGNSFYQPWLDRGMNYSSALFAGGDTLEQA